MAVTVKKTKIHKKDEHLYVPHKIRSHPFYFIGLPFLGVLVTMFYWIVLCPLLFVTFLHLFGNRCCWLIYFWIAALLIFIVIVSILVCIWRCTSRRKRVSHYKMTVEETTDDVDSISDSVINETLKKVDDAIDEAEEAKMFPRCSVRQKPRPQSLKLDQGDPRPVSQNLSSPLTPRELFFIDLIETANRSCSSTTHTFIEKEKENYSPDDNSVRWSSDKQECSSPSEFFIANIPVQNTCTSQVFFYVEEVASEPQFVITCESAKAIMD